MPLLKRTLSSAVVVCLALAADVCNSDPVSVTPQRAVSAEAPSTAGTADSPRRRA